MLIMGTPSLFDFDVAALQSLGLRLTKSRSTDLYGQSFKFRHSVNGIQTMRHQFGQPAPPE
jgi:hypothetical protein